MTATTSRARYHEEDQPIYFLRHGITVSGVFESICCECGNRVGYSPNMEVLQAAEESHVCSYRPKHLMGSG